MYKIAIRADGGPDVGMGHIMRCLAIAEELRNLGCKVYFISKYKQGIDKLESMGFEAFELAIENINANEKENSSSTETYEYSNSSRKFEQFYKMPKSVVDTGFNYGSVEELEDDLLGTRTIIEQQNCDLLLVDKYNLSTEYFNRLREIVGKVAFIDDLNLYKCSADIIINGNINAPLLGYKENFIGQKLLLATDFTPLRKEFRDILKRVVYSFDNWDLTQDTKSKVGSRLPEIMITTGGSDPYNCTDKLLEILLGDKKTANIRYNVIVSSGFVHKDRLQRMADENSNIVLYIDPTCMSEIMCRSDLAISSGGSTLYELCCCGTPTLAFIMADNQKGIVDMLAKDGYICLIGWYNDIENTNLTQIVYDLINDFMARKDYSQKLQSLIDGRGALRIAQEIVIVVKNKII